mmetsp:Transcript_39803/g.89275  ORF Transcript_39803/g.89275 Transcript_39803/m.89275 type:complete len:245 (+) Transcript_39803:777-1511(+)
MKGRGSKELHGVLQDCAGLSCAERVPEVVHKQGQHDSVRSFTLEDLHWLEVVHAFVSQCKGLVGDNGRGGRRWCDVGGHDTAFLPCQNSPPVLQALGQAVVRALLFDQSVDHGEGTVLCLDLVGSETHLREGQELAQQGLPCWGFAQALSRCIAGTGSTDMRVCGGAEVGDRRWRLQGLHKICNDGIHGHADPNEEGAVSIAVRTQNDLLGRAEQTLQPTAYLRRLHQEITSRGRCNLKVVRSI